jgi:hypothetical protein
MKGFALIAALIAFTFLVKASRQPRVAVFVAVLVWLAYAVYEWQVATGVLCDANCNIRVDLLLFWPILLMVTLFASYAPGEWTPTGRILRVIGLVILTLILAPFVYIYLFESGR